MDLILKCWKYKCSGNKSEIRIILGADICFQIAWSQLYMWINWVTFFIYVFLESFVFCFRMQKCSHFCGLMVLGNHFLASIIMKRLLYCRVRVKWYLEVGLARRTSYPSCSTVLAHYLFSVTLIRKSPFTWNAVTTMWVCNFYYI